MALRSPAAAVLLRRAQLILILAILLPTVAMTAVGIVLLALGNSSIAIVAGVLSLAFCTTALTGYILGSIFVSRGASLSRLQSEFLSAVSHEIRTPITSLQMFVETLKDGRAIDEPERCTCLEMIHRELGRLDALVGKLLDLSRIETGREAYERKPISVVSVVDEAVGALQTASLADPVDLEVSVADELHIWGDRAALARALGNLLTNAWKYGTRSSSEAEPIGARTRVIHVSARRVGRRGGRIEIAVEDHGPGVKADEREQIFAPFQRGRIADERRLPGVGLGLAVARGIVQAHRGRIEVGAATSGQGARFSLILPSCPPECVKAASVTKSAANLPEPAPKPAADPAEPAPKPAADPAEPASKPAADPAEPASKSAADPPEPAPKRASEPAAAGEAR